MDQLKRQAAARALDEVRDGMQLGLGTGSTAKHFVELLGERVRSGLKVIGVPTSEATRADAIRCGVPLTTLDEIDHLDLTVDGADEVDPELNLIKGGGGALLREKIVAAASYRMIVIADDSKWVEVLGRFPLPIEVIPMARALVARELTARGGRPLWREGFVTDNGNHILDVHGLTITDPVALERDLNQITGVVTVGLFAVRPADALIVGTAGGVETR